MSTPPWATRHPRALILVSGESPRLRDALRFVGYTARAVAAEKLIEETARRAPAAVLLGGEAFASVGAALLAARQGTPVLVAIPTGAPAWPLLSGADAVVEVPPRIEDLALAIDPLLERGNHHRCVAPDTA